MDDTSIVAIQEIRNSCHQTSAVRAVVKQYGSWHSVALALLKYYIGEWIPNPVNCVTYEIKEPK